MITPQSLAYVNKLRESPSFGTDGFDLEGLRQGMATRREPTVEGVQCIPAQIDDLPAEWVVADDADPDVRLLYLHGGGYVSGSGAFYLAMAAHLAIGARCAVLLLDYRLAPEHPFPCGLEDCLRAYDWLINNGPSGPGRASALFIAGDSAGGGLTLASLMALRDRKRPLPLAGIALSPWSDMTLSGASIQSEGENDPIMHPSCLPDFVNLYVSETDVRHPYASPVFGDYTGLPPLLIQVGEHEIIRDDSVRVAAKARTDGVTVAIDIWPGLFHVFQSHEPLLPEARESIARMADFMREAQAGTLQATASQAK